VLTRLAVCVAMAAARVAELRYSRHNIRGALVSREGDWSRATYPLIVALHTLVIGGTLLRGGRPRWHWLLLLFVVQPVRLWVLTTLRGRWNTRAAVPDDLAVETGGPYAFVRHPNYSVVTAELLALPLAFGMRRLALIATLANALLLSVRIPEEEALLMERPGYAGAFRRKARFIPGWF
jgi:methyltransferase